MMNYEGLTLSHRGCYAADGVDDQVGLVGLHHVVAALGNNQFAAGREGGEAVLTFAPSVFKHGSGAGEGQSVGDDD